jgi:hypothetical protein
MGSRGRDLGTLHFDRARLMVAIQTSIRKSGTSQELKEEDGLEINK